MSSSPITAPITLAEIHPCSSCGYPMRGGTTCWDCKEYGPPRCTCGAPKRYAGRDRGFVCTSESHE
jgi:hypothetical protein